MPPGATKGAESHRHMLLFPFPGGKPRDTFDMMIEHPVACSVGRLDVTSL